MITLFIVLSIFFPILGAIVGYIYYIREETKKELGLQHDVDPFDNAMWFFLIGMLWFISIPVGIIMLLSIAFHNCVSTKLKTLVKAELKLKETLND